MAVTDDAIAAIRQMIVAGDYPVTGCPREADLADRLGLSPAATRMPDDEIRQLAGLLDAPADDPDVEELVATDLEFHHRIAAGSGNPALYSLLASIPGRTQRARACRAPTQDRVVAQTVGEHRATQRALLDRDPERARS